MPDVSQLQPIFQENVDRIRARVNADANVGLDPSDPSFLDTTPGGFWWDITQAMILEAARLWDALGAEVVAAAFPTHAWGTYLDEHAITVGLARKPAAASSGVVTFSGETTATGTVFLATGTQVATQQATADSDPVIFATTAPATIPAAIAGVAGKVDVPIQAVTGGSAGNQPAAAVTVLLSAIQGVGSLTNAAGVTGGSDVESDEQLRQRILLQYQGSQGSGTVADYQGWALAYPGVGFVAVQPLWSGAGTVRVVITDADNRPCPAGIVAGLQNQLDPTSGLGLGLAPIGATVTVATPSTVSVNVGATLTLATGYTFDGAGGTIALGPELSSIAADYINGLPAGTPVIRQALIARFFDVVGVEDVIGLTLNSASTNFTPGSLQVAQVGTVSLG